MITKVEEIKRSRMVQYPDTQIPRYSDPSHLIALFTALGFLDGSSSTANFASAR
jgi:hypothetical protein